MTPALCEITVLHRPERKVEDSASFFVLLSVLLDGWLTVSTFPFQNSRDGEETLDWGLGGVATINNDVIKYICGCCSFTHCVITNGEHYIDNLSDGLRVPRQVFSSYCGVGNFYF